MTRYATIPAPPGRWDSPPPFDELVEQQLAARPLRPRRCDWCLVRWCETVHTEHCPFCGCDRNGNLA